eukprot:symbB.v1.2.015518.t1/scaffold1152.1/size135547/8
MICLVVLTGAYAFLMFSAKAVVGASVVLDIEKSTLGLISLLFGQGMWVPALIILLYSVMMPFAKLFALVLHLWPGNWISVRHAEIQISHAAASGNVMNTHRAFFWDYRAEVKYMMDVFSLKGKSDLVGHDSHDTNARARMLDGRTKAFKAAAIAWCIAADFYFGILFCARDEGTSFQALTINLVLLPISIVVRIGGSFDTATVLVSMLNELLCIFFTAISCCYVDGMLWEKVVSTIKMEAKSQEAEANMAAAKKLLNVTCDACVQLTHDFQITKPERAFLDILGGGEEVEGRK